MYLIQIDEITGLVDLSLDYDGFYCIPEFRKLLKDKVNGVKKLTVVALVVDYQSPIKHYAEKEKPFKAMDLVFSNRKTMLIADDDVQEAMLAYKALQYDLDLEEQKMLNNMRFEKQNEMDKEPDLNKKLSLMKQLSTVKEAIKNFNLQAAGRDLYEGSPVRNGYTLSRLEQKLLNKKSFYYDKEDELSEEADD